MKTAAGSWTTKATEGTSGMEHAFEVTEEVVTRKTIEPTSSPWPDPATRVEEWVIHERVKYAERGRCEQWRIEVGSEALVFIEETFCSKTKGWTSE